ncbi:7631_t:CDS:2, partial [Gigaspora margarita]
EKDNDIIVAQRRLEHFNKALKSQDSLSNDSSIDSESSASTIRIGDVTLKISDPKNPELVPYYVKPLFEDSQDDAKRKTWSRYFSYWVNIIRPLRRSIVLRYAQFTNREIEYVPLSNDCTDSDLKQRREISGGTAYY